MTHGQVRCTVNDTRYRQIPCSSVAGVIIIRRQVPDDHSSGKIRGPQSQSRLLAWSGARYELSPPCKRSVDCILIGTFSSKPKRSHSNLPPLCSSLIKHASQAAAASQEFARLELEIGDLAGYLQRLHHDPAIAARITGDRNPKPSYEIWITNTIPSSDESVWSWHTVVSCEGLVVSL